MSRKEVAVIGGSEIDTQLGVEYFNSKGLKANPFPITSAAEEYELLLRDFNVITEVMKNRTKEIKKSGVNNIIIFCNSLSSVIDVEELSLKEHVRIITPLTVYRNIAKTSDTLGVIAGNNQGLAGIERVILNVNPNCKVIGLSMLPLVIDIERNIPAKEIVYNYSLEKIFEFYELNKVSTIISGCTHFSYLQDEMTKLTTLNVYDPAESIANTICSL